MFYGPPHANSLHLLRHYFSQYPEDASKVVVSIKGAFDRTAYIPIAPPKEFERQLRHVSRYSAASKASTSSNVLASTLRCPSKQVSRL